MGIVEFVTVIFVVCKVMGKEPIAHWSWFQVFMPELIAIAFYFLIAAITCWFLLRAKNEHQP